MTAFDTNAFDQALFKARGGVQPAGLALAFDEAVHPRGPGGRWAIKGLHVGVSVPTQTRLTVRAPTSVAYTQQQLMAPLKHVEHKAINSKLRQAGRNGNPLPRNGHEGFFGRAGPYPSTEYDIAGLDFNMALNTTKREVTVLRAVPATAVQDLHVGSVYTDHGFVSTSQSLDGLGYFVREFSTYKTATPAYMKITVPKGTHAYDHGPKDEDRELVLDRGLTYEVTGEERTPEGARVLLVRVVGPADRIGPMNASLDTEAYALALDQARSAEYAAEINLAAQDAVLYLGGGFIDVLFDPTKHPRGWHGHWARHVDNFIDQNTMRARHSRGRVGKGGGNPYARYTRSGKLVRTAPMPARHQQILEALAESKPARMAKNKWHELQLMWHTLRDPRVSKKDKAKLAAGIAASIGTYVGLSHLGPIGALIAASPLDDLLAGAILQRAIHSASGKPHPHKDGGIHPALAHIMRVLHGQHSTTTMHAVAAHLTAGYQVPLG